MTEKDYNPEQRNKKVMENKKAVAKAPVQKTEKKVAESQGDSENKEVINKKDSGDKASAGGDKKKKPEQPKVKKSEAIVRGMSLPLSTKTAAAVCKFIKGKQIQKAISDLEQVVIKKKAVPMKGEIPHRKGKIMSGRFPKKTSEYFIRLLKNLQANSNANGLDEPVIVEAIANIASQPYGRFGRVRRKRSHVKLKAMDRKEKGGKEEKWKKET